MSSMKRKRFSCSKASLMRDNKTYSEITCHRSFASQFIPTDQYDVIQSLHTINHNTTRNPEINKISPLTDQAHYNSLRNDGQSSDAWFVKLLPSTDTAKEQIKLPVTTFEVTIRYLVSSDDDFTVSAK